MGFKVVQFALGAAVASGGTAAGIAYPSGTNQAFFTGGNASATGVVVVNGNDIYRESASRIGLTYGASTITLTNSSGQTWPAGADITLQMGYLGGGTVTVIQQAAEADIAGTLTGTTDGALADLTTLTDSPTSADALRDQLMSAWKVEIDSHFKDVLAKINSLLAKLRASGVISS